MKFSERIGITEAKSKIQLDEIDDDLRNGLWSIFVEYYIVPMRNQDGAMGRINLSSFYRFTKTLWFSYLKKPLDEIPRLIVDVCSIFKKNFYEYEWFDIYNFLEFVAKNPGPIDNEKFIETCNYVLKRELSGYRFIANELTPISDENQIGQIQDALDNTDKTSLRGVHIHLQASLHKLSDKKIPDYRNSIKESISAVESLCQIISGDKKAELGKALKIIKDKIGMHTALEQGFIKIYGYTSDGDGIRHCLTEESNVDLEDAIYMLTSCSAFINYLIVKADKSGVSLK